MIRSTCFTVLLCCLTTSLGTGFLVTGFLVTPALSQEPSAKVSLVVGNWLPGETKAASSKPGPLKQPFGIDFDAAGNMTIVELGGGRVHRLDPTGKFTTISGDGSKNYTGDGGPAAQATYNGMHNVAVTPGGNIYIADSWNHCIRKIDHKTGLVTTIAGTGEPGFSGDGGPARQAKFNFIMSVTLNGANDKIYLADLKNHRIRVVDLKTKLVSTIAGNGKQGVPQNGALAVDSPLVDPRAVAVDSQQRVYILERGGNALRRVETDGTITTVAGTGRRGHRDGPALAALLGSPKHVCVDSLDNVYIADDTNGAIRKYDPLQKTVSTVAGRGKGRPAVTLSHPHGVCVEKNMLYIVDMGHDRILKMPLPVVK